MNVLLSVQYIMNHGLGMGRSSERFPVVEPLSTRYVQFTLFSTQPSSQCYTDAIFSGRKSEAHRRSL